MPQRSTFRQQSRRMSLGGVMAALTVVILSLGSLVPLATFACPLLAMVCLIPLVCRYGPGAALTVYAGAGILSLFLCADKELAFLYAFLGWYPALRPRLEGLAALDGGLLKYASQKKPIQDACSWMTMWRFSQKVSIEH